MAHRCGAFAVAELLPRRLLACIVHEDSASRVNSANQVARSPEERGLPRNEGDRARCDALLTLVSNRQSVIFGNMLNDD